MINSAGLNIIISDGNFRDRMFDNLIAMAPYKVETPKIFDEYVIKIHELIYLVNEVVANPAYVICYKIFESHWRFAQRFGSYVYFTDEYDSMAFKLRW